MTEVVLEPETASNMLDCEPYVSGEAVTMGANSLHEWERLGALA